jgi:pilus assembly protein Flp/PilA
MAWATVLKDDKRAVTMLEYGLIAALVAVACISAFQLLATNISSMIGTVAGDILPKS